MITKRETALLKALTSEKAKGGLPAGMRYLDEFAEMEQKGLVRLSGARTGILVDPDVFWVTLTDAGRDLLARTLAP
jgi:hypothetical protein